jgi:hypothetical protein
MHSSNGDINKLHGVHSAMEENLLAEFAGEFCYRYFERMYDKKQRNMDSMI